MNKRWVLSALFVSFSTFGIAFADEVEGIYGCSGYYKGFSTNYDNVGLKMTLNVGDFWVYLNGDYNFFGSNIKNPLDGLEYLNCGVKYPPDFRFNKETCEEFKKDGSGFNVQDFGDLNLATMRLDVYYIADDASAHFDCVKTQF